jgi:Type II secretion system (T2SS), protein E, N-terminal domain
MPLLMRRRMEHLQPPGLGRDSRTGEFLPGRPQQRSSVPGDSRTAVFPRCANSSCANGWLRLWRSRSAPVFEGGWCCSPECTQARVDAALTRELGVVANTGTHYRHRIPLGLSMLEKGWITPEDLRGALEAQREAGGGRLGQWLIHKGAISEAKLTRALALQWSCPVLGLELHDPQQMALMIPRLFVDALGVLPLRVAAQRVLYLAFEDRPDPVLAVALERMTGLRVECGVLEGSAFRTAHARALEARYASVDLLEASSGKGLTRALANAIEQAESFESRLVRVHEFLWLRIWRQRQTSALPHREEVRDIIVALTSSGEMA